ncbi:hypothetical protein GLE_1014 [Lysobacter enzymogenes]|uniref:Uncharacterized protein n=1 Tax=Lysobacter enzymogenes TaxID=69 RepID=A0A0S2DCW4_LYSEN|nr:hypothetical protein GLE_1014 [Lysobacter enzymogenes]
MPHTFRRLACGRVSGFPGVAGDDRNEAFEMICKPYRHIQALMAAQYAQRH